MRIAVTGLPDKSIQDLDARIRGAELSSDPSSSEALAFFQSDTSTVPLVEKATRASKPVLFSVPAISHQDQWQALRNLAKGTDLVLQNPYRFLPSRVLIVQQLEANKLGDVGLARIHRWFPGQFPEPSPNFSGSLLCDIEFFVDVMKGEPELVFAVSQKFHPESTGVSIHFGFQKGGMGLLDHQQGGGRAGEYQYLSLIGSAGAVYSDDLENLQLHFTDQWSQAIRVSEGLSMYAAMLQDFVNRQTKKPSKRPPNWDAVERVAKGIETSLKTQQSVWLQGGQP